MVLRQGLTLEEFLNLPEQEPALEFADGEITQKVSPQGRHSRLTHGLDIFFWRELEVPGIALVFPELRVTFARGSRVPDFVVYRWDRVSCTAEGDVVDQFTDPPDVAVELASPEQSLTTLADKCAWYVANGVPIALLVEPDARAVRVYRPGAPVAVLRDGDAIDFDAVFPGAALRVSDLFAAMRPRRSRRAHGQNT